VLSDVYWISRRSRRDKRTEATRYENRQRHRRKTKPLPPAPIPFHVPVTYLSLADVMMLPDAALTGFCLFRSASMKIKLSGGGAQMNGVP